MIELQQKRSRNILDPTSGSYAGSDHRDPETVDLVRSIDSLLRAIESEIVYARGPKAKALKKAKRAALKVRGEIRTASRL